MPNRRADPTRGHPFARRPGTLLGAVLLVLLQACATPQEAPVPAPRQPPAAAAPALNGRLIVDAQEYPWSAIGRLNLAGQGFCNGILIGPREVLTQARCLYDGRDGRWFLPRELHFIAAYQKDEFLADSPIARFVTAPGFSPTGGTSLANITNNWAVVTLERPIGRQTGWLGLEWDSDSLQAAAARGEAVYLRAGYRPDWAHAISLHFGCAEGGPDLAGLCAATPMEQGLPPFVMSGNELRVLGDFYLRSAAEADGMAELAAARSGDDRLGGARPPAGNSPVRAAPEVSIALLLRGLGYDVDSAGRARAVADFRRDHRLSAGADDDVVALLRQLITAARAPSAR